MMLVLATAWLPLCAMAQTVSVVALGDSLTAGYGLPQKDGFVPQLQSWLVARGEQVKVLNAGVSGDTTAGGLARLRWTLTPDVDGVIVALGGNDLLRGIDPAAARKNLSGILEITAERGLPVLLVGMKAPGNYGADYKAEFDAIYPELAAQYGTLYFENFLGVVVDRTTPGVVVRQHMQADNIHPNATGVLEIVTAIGPSVVKLLRLAQQD